MGGGAGQSLLAKPDRSICPHKDERNGRYVTGLSLASVNVFNPLMPNVSIWVLH